MEFIDEFRNIYRFYVYETLNSGKKAEEDLLWYPSRFHKFLCDEVQRFLEEKSDNPYDILILSTPPQHGKSITITGTLPSWYLSRNPDSKCIIVSYGDDNAKKFGKMNLDKFKRFGELFGLSVDKSRAGSKEWRISGHEGVCISAGYGGTITSNSANLMLIDDPVKNAVQADSEKDRDTKWDDFLMTLDSRMSAGGKIILIMTRWHENDLAGMLIEAMPDQCRLVNIPLICEEDGDPLGRKKGEAILTEPELPVSMQKDTKWALNKKKILSNTESGTRTWNALWQGRPSALEGNIIKREWWQYYEVSDYEDGTLKFERMIMTVDAAFKDSKKNDYVAIGVWGKRHGRIYLVDMINEHLSFSETVRKIRVLDARHQKVKGILIEEAANGSAIIQTLKEQAVMGVVAVNPDRSKDARVHDCSFYIEAGNVYLPRDKSFTWGLIDQFAVFPNGKHDDIVDMSTMAIGRLAHMRTMRDTMRSVRSARDEEWHYQRSRGRFFAEEKEVINVV